MKRCPKCGETKSLDAFHRWSRRDGRQPWCKACRKVYDAEYFQRTKHRRRPHQERHAEFRAWFEKLKSRPCADCGTCFPPEVMHWDHLPGVEKLGDVCTLARRHSKRKVLAEIEKCELVYANCHAVRTASRRRARGV